MINMVKWASDWKIWKIRAIWRQSKQLYKQVFRGDFSNAYCYINALLKTPIITYTQNNTPSELGLTALELFEPHEVVYKEILSNELKEWNGTQD